MTKVAIVGATGRMGVQTVAAVQALGADPVALSRRTGFDLSAHPVDTLSARLAGCSAVIDCSDATDRQVATFTGNAQRLAAAADRAGVTHVVVLSIVGVDRPGLARMGYYQGKLAQEQALAVAAAPVSVLRATQWYEFADMVFMSLPLPGLGRVGLAPAMASQPVAGSSVGRRLAELALGDPVGRIELAGPEPMLIPELVRRVNAARGTPVKVAGFPVPGIPGFSDGSLRPGPDAEIDPVTIQEWIALAH